MLNIYALHDTKIFSIEVEKSSFYLTFNQGVYNLDASGREINLTSKCVLQLSIQAADNILDNIQIIKYRKGRFKEISLCQFQKMLKNSFFDVDCDYHSNFDNAILLKGYVKNFGIEIVICDIEQVEFLF